jgi:hypothetical protein
MSDRSLVFIALQTADGSYLCAEGGGGRELVANRPAVGPWETFRLIWLSDSTLALRAFNGQHVCAENGGGREVVANRDAIGPWETFTWRVVGLRGDRTDRIALRAFNGQHVCAENGGGREVVANRDAIGEWERFRIVTPPDSVLRMVGGWGA